MWGFIWLSSLRLVGFLLTVSIWFCLQLWTLLFVCGCVILHVLVTWRRFLTSNWKAFFLFVNKERKLFFVGTKKRKIVGKLKNTCTHYTVHKHVRDDRFHLWNSFFHNAYHVQFKCTFIDQIFLLIEPQEKWKKKWWLRVYKM